MWSTFWGQDYHLVDMGPLGESLKTRRPPVFSNLTCDSGTRLGTADRLTPMSILIDWK